MNAISKVLNKAKTGVKKVGKFLDKEFIEPSRKVSQYNAKTNALNKAKLKSGKLNTGEESAESQSY